MNYIKEINAFYDTIERNPLSMPAITLWFALMHINNKAHWSNTFTVAVAVLQFKAGLTESTFKRARKELIEKGYITHRAGNQTQSATYRIARLTREVDETNCHPEQTHSTNQPTDKERHVSTNQTTQHAHIKDAKHQNMNPNMDPNANPNTNPNTAPLIKQNKTKPKQNETNNQQQADAIRFFQDNFGTCSPFVMESIQDWTSDFPEELIIYAMERALEQGKERWGYVKGILNNWHKTGINTLQAAKADTNTLRKNNQPKQRSPDQEIIPEWFTALQQQQKPAPETKTYTTEEEEAIIQETQAILDACT